MKPFATLIETTRLQAGDVVEYHGRKCKVESVSPCCAVLRVPQPPREFFSRAGRKVRVKVPPATARISANAPLPILHRKQKPQTKGTVP